ncbi:MAG: TnsA endonuclease N-terminal domain-containing protein [Alicyclobacillus shizuokensis]|nr:TnsA endonuclease N-terminal domain-containing protein [Alicyclobacillus shizuokensis]
MDWLNKSSWAAEDMHFAPKRKVNNRGSQRKPHVIGAFHSPKMNTVVEYESLGEYLFQVILELDSQVVRYYVQPVEIPILFVDSQGRRRHWIHVPDVLVFRQGSIPHLYQVKEASEDTSERLERVNACCLQFARERGWDYSVIRPKTIPDVVQKNAKFLFGFLQPKPHFERLLPEVVSRLAILHSSSIAELAKSFRPKAHPVQVLPVIYHLIAVGVFSVDVRERIDEWSEVRFVRERSTATTFLNWGESHGA